MRSDKLEILRGTCSQRDADYARDIEISKGGGMQTEHYRLVLQLNEQDAPGFSSHTKHKKGDNYIIETTVTAVLGEQPTLLMSGGGYGRRTARLLRGPVCERLDWAANYRPDHRPDIMGTGTKIYRLALDDPGQLKRINNSKSSLDAFLKKALRDMEGSVFYVDTDQIRIIWAHLLYHEPQWQVLSQVVERGLRALTQI